MLDLGISKMAMIGVVALIVIIAVLIVRPSGLFGRKLVTRV